MYTFPGTEINVTPEREVPIIPKATRYHLLERFPVKKVSDVAFFDVKMEIKIKIPK